MILAPLQLVDYWMDSIHLRANPAYNRDQPNDLNPDLIHLKADVKELPSDNRETHGTRWLVTLSIDQKIPEGKNVPYEFSIQLTGVVCVHPSLKGETLTHNIQVNGPSMLFGSAREIIRAATSRGPFAPLIIPSTSFLQRIPQPKPSAEKETAVEKKPARPRKKKNA
jgi:preprotein translocase subunit SecB